MAVPSPTSLPPSLRPIAHHLKTAAEYETRDPAALKLDRTSPEAKKTLVPLMDWLEKEKKILKDNEAISSEIVATAHIENFALKLFLWADREDRAAHFNKNVVKAFYTAGNLYEALNVLGELTPENVHHRDYAKWKAAYIHNCLKNGETPIPGPVDGAPQREDAGGEDQAVGGQPTYFDQPAEVGGWSQPVPAPRKPVQQTFSETQLPAVPQQPGANNFSDAVVASATTTGSILTPEMTAKAQKYCKYATSSLDYEDIATAVDYLQKALKILQTGKE